jgi:hypothetical protein
MVITIPFRITSFADPHSLTPIESYLCKKHRGVGSVRQVFLAVLLSPAGQRMEVLDFESPAKIHQSRITRDPALGCARLQLSTNPVARPQRYRRQRHDWMSLDQTEPVLLCDRR